MSCHSSPSSVELIYRHKRSQGMRSWIALLQNLRALDRKMARPFEWYSVLPDPNNLYSNGPQVIAWPLASARRTLGDRGPCEHE
jgi:hypothetical protein